MYSVLGEGDSYGLDSLNLDAQKTFGALIKI